MDHLLGVFEAEVTSQEMDFIYEASWNIFERQDSRTWQQVRAHTTIGMVAEIVWARHHKFEWSGSCFDHDKVKELGWDVRSPDGAKFDLKPYDDRGFWSYDLDSSDHIRKAVTEGKVDYIAVGKASHVSGRTFATEMRMIVPAAMAYRTEPRRLRGHNPPQAEWLNEEWWKKSDKQFTVTEWYFDHRIAGAPTYRKAA